MKTKPAQAFSKRRTTVHVDAMPRALVELVKQVERSGVQASSGRDPGTCSRQARSRRGRAAGGRGLVHGGWAAARRGPLDGHARARTSAAARDLGALPLQGRKNCRARRIASMSETASFSTRPGRRCAAPGDVDGEGHDDPVHPPKVVQKACRRPRSRCAAPASGQQLPREVEHRQREAQPHPMLDDRRR